MNGRAPIAIAIAVVAGLWFFALRGEDPPTTPRRPNAISSTWAASAPSVRQRTAKPRPSVPVLHPEKLDTTARVIIDGRLDEPAWQTATKVPLVDVRTGAPNQDFPVNGSVRLLWDDTGFYVGFEVSDRDVIGGFEKGAKDPHLWTRDTVEIMVDPDGDGDNTDYYEIQIGPQNLVFDSAFDRYNEPRREPDGPFGHEDWSSNVTSAVVVDGTLDQKTDHDEGYVVEALLPWKSFGKAKRIPPAIGDTWRLNFYAMQDNGGVAWSPIANAGNFHTASRFGRVVWTAKGGPRGRARLLFDRTPLPKGMGPLLVPSMRPPDRLKPPTNGPARD